MGLLAQAGKSSAAPKGTAPKAATSKAKANPKDTESTAEAEAVREPKERAEVYRDPLAEAVLKNTKNFRPLEAGQPVPLPQVLKMAQGQVVIDKNLLDEYVRHSAGQMASARVLKNLAQANNALANQAALREVEQAYEALIKPVTDATKGQPNRPFLADYTQSLLKVMPDLLANHLYARIEGMLVLSKTGDSQAIDTFIAQLRDPKQVTMVKLLACNGLINITGGGRRGTNPPEAALRAAAAVNDYLNTNPNLIWPAQFRALEALGALRQPSINPAVSKFEMVETAKKFLADPKVRPEVRAWAAWALGMMRVENANATVNYADALHNLGQLAAELGDKIVAVKSMKDVDQAHDLIGLLGYPIFEALKGNAEVPKSGLLTMPPVRAKAAQVADNLGKLVQDEARDAVELGRVPPTSRAQKRAELTARITKLKEFLDQNQPRVVAGGPKRP